MSYAIKGGLVDARQILPSSPIAWPYLSLGRHVTVTCCQINAKMANRKVQVQTLVSSLCQGKSRVILAALISLDPVIVQGVKCPG